MGCSTINTGSLNLSAIKFFKMQFVKVRLQCVSMHRTGTEIDIALCSTAADYRLFGQGSSNFPPSLTGEAVLSAQCKRIHRISKLRWQ